MPHQSIQEQMIELQKMQLKAFEESEKRQQQFLEQMIEVTDNAENRKDRQFFMELVKVLSK